MRLCLPSAGYRREALSPRAFVIRCTVTSSANLINAVFMTPGGRGFCFAVRATFIALSPPTRHWSKLHVGRPACTCSCYSETVGECLHHTARPLAPCYTRLYQLKLSTTKGFNWRQCALVSRPGTVRQFAVWRPLLPLSPR